MIVADDAVVAGSSSSSRRRCCCCCCCCCCCWQRVRLPPHGVVRFLCRHVLKLEFRHYAHPELNLHCVFASVFAVFSSKKCDSRRATLCSKMLSSPFRIVVFGVFLCVSHFASLFLRCFCRLSNFCTCQLRLEFVFQLCAGVAVGWRG